MAKKPRIQAHVRWMLARDILALVDMEQRIGGWDAQRILEVKRQHGVVPMVAESISTRLVHGYALFRIHPRGFEMLRLLVHPDYRRRGVGSQLINRICNKLDPIQKRRLVLDVHERDLAMQLFLRSCGFQATRILHGAYVPDDGIRFVFYVMADVPAAPTRR